jgi:hypothetical protein
VDCLRDSQAPAKRASDDNDPFKTGAPYG